MYKIWEWSWSRYNDWKKCPEVRCRYKKKMSGENEVFLKQPLHVKSKQLYTWLYDVIKLIINSH